MMSSSWTSFYPPPPLSPSLSASRSGRFGLSLGTVSCDVGSAGKVSKRRILFSLVLDDKPFDYFYTPFSNSKHADPAHLTTTGIDTSLHNQILSL